MNDSHSNSQNNNNNNNTREQSERRMALDALERDAATVWRELPERFRHDKEFILKALQAPELPHKSDFERQFPQSLRFDKDVVLGFCAREDFAQLFLDRHLYVPECLTSDKQVMMAYCTKIHRSLQECSEELCDDKDIVLAAIALDGLELQYASLRLQEEKEVIIKACQRDGKALEFCPPGPVREELVSDREFMLQVLRQHGGPMLRLVPKHFKYDRELLLEALKHGMRFRYCPFEFQNDKQFLLEALANRSQLYLEMNRNTQKDVDICQAAIVSQNSTPEVHTRVLEHAPDLPQQREVALAIVQRGSEAFMKQLIVESFSDAFKDDLDIMLTAIRRTPKLFGYASPRLQQHVDVIIAAIEGDTGPDVLAAVGPEILRLFPRIVTHAIQTCPRRQLRILRSQIPADLWTSNRPICMAYIQQAGRVLDVFEPRLQTDREMALHVAQYAGCDFGRVGEQFRNDLEFMYQAVDRNGRVLRYASRELLRGPERMPLVIRAVANHAGALASHSIHVTEVMRHHVGETNNHQILPTTETVLAHVQQKLDLHKVFVQEFLRGICILRRVAPSRRSPLRMLDRGIETSQALKQLIAAFLGVPVAHELKYLRTAHANLTATSPPPDPQQPEDPTEQAGNRERPDRWARRRWLRDRAQGQLRVIGFGVEEEDPQDVLDHDPQVLVGGGAGRDAIPRRWQARLQHPHRRRNPLEDSDEEDEEADRPRVFHLGGRRPLARRGHLMLDQPPDQGPNGNRGIQVRPMGLMMGARRAHRDRHDFEQAIERMAQREEAMEQHERAIAEQQRAFFLQDPPAGVERMVGEQDAMMAAMLRPPEDDDDEMEDLQGFII